MRNPRTVRIVLWLSFAAVHGAVAWLGWVLPNQPMGDVYLVYEPWSERALAGERIVGITEPWVYPILALAPMLLTQALGFLGAYAIGWAVLVTACDAVVFWLLLGRARSRSRIAAAGFWLAYALLLGPVGMYRIDAVTVPLAVAGVLWIAGRPSVAGALLAAATWIKVWPAALLAAVAGASWWRSPRRSTGIAGGALVLTGVVVGTVAFVGGAANLFGFVATQHGRGLQIEAPAAAPYLWGALAEREGWFLYYDRDILTFQVAGPGVDAIAALMNPLLALVALAILVVAAVKARRGAAAVRVLPPTALALTLAMIVCNKVGSPQFHTWLIAPLVLWIVWDRPRARPLAIAALACAALTQLVYPLLYGSVLAVEVLGIAVLTVRNAGLVALLAWTIVRLARVPASALPRVRRGAVPEAERR